MALRIGARMRLSQGEIIARPTMLTLLPLRSEKSRLNDSGAASYFLLDETAAFAVLPEVKPVGHPQWMHVTHLREARYSLILTAGEHLRSSQLDVFSDSRLYIRFSAALPGISVDGLTCSVVFVDDPGQTEFPLGIFHICGGSTPSEWRLVDLDLAWLAGKRGRLLVTCGPGAKNDPTADWLAIADLCVAREGVMKLLLAKTHHQMRVKNEIAHFSSVYRNEFYSNVQERQSEAAMGVARNVRRLNGLAPAQGQDARSEMVIPEPFEGEVAYSYATRMLRANVPQTPPDFQARLRRKVSDHGAIKVLSICSGAARIEAGLSAAVPEGVEWSLLDINEDLLHIAAKQFSSGVGLDLIVADANNLVPTGEQWDVIICVSALHHLIELEKVMLFISHSLKNDGEFWSVGEAVGRNGNRLWPEAIIAADAAFSALPARYRLNADTQVVDAVIPDKDHSIGCFEGIRSEEITALLERWLKPVDVYRTNCFLWRMVNLAYSGNFNLAKAEDRALVIDMVRAELEHFRNGGLGTELFGVYKKKHLFSDGASDQ
ncbi:class I SAM-dependent methyltransferase [Pseudomonas sp. R3-56]|uniref:class I SAM-dependent methyltransferase n=1 Tax=Pseudomonas sp. R3-56 TaxID=2817401 RepID=UPI003DAA2EE3